MAVMIKMCTCLHAVQDALYGKGMRIFNLCAGKRRGQARCTVCGREQVQ